ILTCTLYVPSTAMCQETKVAVQTSGAAPAGKDSKTDATDAEADASGLTSELSNESLTKKHPELAPAWELLKKGDEKGATDILKAAVSKTPSLPPAELFLAHWYVAQNNGPRALYLLDQTAKANPQDPGAYLTLAALALSQGRFTDATVLLDRG